MKRLIAVLLVMLAPGLAQAGEEIVRSSAPREAAPNDSAAADVFFKIAHVCDNTGTLPCGPDNLVAGSFWTVLQVHVPVTQSYTRHYIVTDVQGAMVGYQTFSGSLTQGSNDLAISFSLPGGKVYRFQAIVSGPGKTALSDMYFFKVL